MPIDAKITLQRLRCIQTVDDGGKTTSDPYIWASLGVIKNDDLSWFVGSIDPDPAEVARVVIKSGMRGGDVANIPNLVGELSQQFEDGLTRRGLILVVALWDKDDTPFNVVKAGYQEFSTALEDAIRPQLIFLAGANDADRNEIIKGIKTTVYDKLYSKMHDSLSGAEKARVYFGWLNLDDFYGSDFKLFAMIDPPGATITSENPMGAASAFTMTFIADLGIWLPPNLIPHFEIDGILEVSGGGLTPLDPGLRRPR